MMQISSVLNTHIYVYIYINKYMYIYIYIYSVCLMYNEYSLPHRKASGFVDWLW